MPIPTGTLIAGRYAVRKQLGTGAQGEVYVVEDTHEGDIVALKLLSSLPQGGPWEEARILRQLTDAHVLPIRNADLAVGQPYLVTELALGGTVAEVVDGAGTRGLDVDDVVRWLRQACHGVARAHDLRLLHNDLKPANMFLNGRGECLVADFGFASLLAPGAVSARPPGATPETAAPEIAASWGTQAATASVASDVYALGATGYWMLAGHPPHDFSGIVGPAAKMATVAANQPVPLRHEAPHVPIAIVHVLEKAMDPIPANRYPDVTAVAAALGQRPTTRRRWSRTDEHSAHIGCWRGERNASAQRRSAFLLCLEPDPRSSRLNIMTTHISTGRKVLRGCRTVPARSWGQAVRATMRRLV